MSCSKPVWNGSRNCRRKAETETCTLLAEGADGVEETVTEPEVQQGRLDNTATPAEATECLQVQGGEERQQEQRKPQTSAEGRQVCVPLQEREVWLSDQQVVPE
jgi:hypothetical protein